jgi:hypothetical protein
MKLVQDDKKPEFAVIMGGTCSGKTTLRKEKYSNGYVNIDAGEIFLKLCQGKYYDFPSHFEGEMNHLGLALIKRCLKDRHNIVIEIIGLDAKLIEDLAVSVNKFNYSVNLILVKCEQNVALERLEKRNAAFLESLKGAKYNSDDDNISAIYCEPYHFSWIKQAALEYSSESKCALLKWF